MYKVFYSNTGVEHDSLLLIVNIFFLIFVFVNGNDELTLTYWFASLYFYIQQP